jgi:hypothetical protein
MRAHQTDSDIGLGSHARRRNSGAVVIGDYGCGSGAWRLGRVAGDVAGDRKVRKIYGVRRLRGGFGAPATAPCLGPGVRRDERGWWGGDGRSILGAGVRNVSRETLTVTPSQALRTGPATPVGEAPADAARLRAVCYGGGRDGVIHT